MRFGRLPEAADLTAFYRLGPEQLDAILPALGPPRRRAAAAPSHAASLPRGPEEEEGERAAGKEEAEEAEEEALRDALLREVRAAYISPNPDPDPDPDPNRNPNPRCAPPRRGAPSSDG